jgi:hypothetical protein
MRLNLHPATLALAAAMMTALDLGIALAAQQPKAPATICIESPTQACANAPPSGGGSGMKWHPGHYMQLSRNHATMSQSVRFGQYNSIATNTALQGVVWEPRWRNLEGDTQGDYSDGFALVHSEINKLKSLAVPKRLIIRMNDLGGAYPADDSFPAYLQAGAPPSLYQPNGRGYTYWRKWSAKVTDSYIAMMQAYAKEFDGEPYLEAIILYRESALQNPPGDYNEPAYDAQMRRLALAVKSAWKQTQVVGAVNYMQSLPVTTAHLQYLASIGVGNDSVDACPDCKIWGDRIQQGVQGGQDLRGTVGIFQGVEDSELGLNAVGPKGGYTATQIGAWANDSQHANYVLWDNQDYTGTAAQRWSTGILPYINANPTPTHTACPTSYSSCNTN